MRKFILVFVICSLAVGCSVASGAGLNNSVFDRDTETIIISGTAEKNSDITIEVCGPDGSMDGITDDSSEEDSPLIFIKQLQTDEEGCYSISFPAKYGSGKYSVRVYSAAEDEYWENNGLTVYSADDIDKLVKVIAGIDSIDDIEIILDPDTVEILGLDVSKTEGMDASGLNELYSCLLNEKKEYNPSNVSEIQNLLDRAFLLYTINSESNAGALKNIISENNDILKLDSACSMDLYTDENIYDDTRRNNMLAKLTGQKYSSLNEFKLSFGDKALLYAVYAQSSYHTIASVLEKSEVIKKCDLSAYNALKDKTSVLKKLNACSAPFETVEALAAAIKGWCNAGDTQNTGGGGGKTSGGGKTVASVGSEPVNTQKDSGGTEYFNDISGFEWAKEAIYTLKEKGIVSGRGENRFCPEDNITREEFLKLLLEAAELKNAGMPISFEDVGCDDWYYSYVASGVSLGIVKGKDNNKFGVGEFITREDMAVMAGRVLEYSGIDLPLGENIFSDFSSVSEYAKGYVIRLGSNKIINGVGENQFAPKLYLNRASAAKMVFETYKLIQEYKKGGQ